MTTKIGFIGCGMMGRALVAGIIKAAVVLPQNIIGCDPHAGSLEAVAALGATTTTSVLEVASFSTVIVIAVKPNDVKEVLSVLQPVLTPAHLLVSIAAGITIASIQQGTSAEARIVRVMPNTPCVVGECASAFAANTNATAADIGLVSQLLSAVGLAVHVPESKLDAVTGVSGSGPAYVFIMIEALADGGVKMGLPRDIALKLAAQTVLGAAKMVLTTGTHPAVLKDQVCSPEGTTIAGVHQLEQAGVRAAFINAVQAATIRSKELGKN